MKMLRVSGYAAVFVVMGLAAAAAQTYEGEIWPKSLKERLSDKASDEQRVDNCHVPLDQRGSKPRPDCSLPAAAETRSAAAPASSGLGAPGLAGASCADGSTTEGTPSACR